MKITNEFTVHTPIERAWEALTDLPGIAPCLPGAQLTGVDGDTYQGKVKVKVGPVISDFNGTARFTEKDDDAYRAVIDAKGRDARAGGNASALVTAVLQPAGDSTVVSVDTDLKISGKLAQFGSGMIKEISGKLLAQFVTNLEAKLATESTAAPAGTDDTTPPLTGAAASTNPLGSTAAPNGTAPSAAAVDTVPGTAAVVASGPPAARPSPEAPSPATLTANLIPADPGAAEPATPAVAGSEPLAGSTTTAPDAVTAPSATTAPPTPAASSATPIRDPHAAAATDEPEALDLLAVAGGSVYKRLIPAAVGAVVVVGVIVWLVGRR